MGIHQKNKLFLTIFIISITLLIIYSIYTYNNPKLIELQLLTDDKYEEMQILNFSLFPQTNNRLIDLLDFKNVINSNICNNTTNITAIIIVTSYFANVETRSAMRRAFPPTELEKLNIKRVFLLGLAPNNIYIKQESIEDESKRFQDIVQGNFQEAYRNLTYKHMMGLKWVTNYCNSTKFVIKMDDDIVVNYYKLTEIFNDVHKFVSNKNKLMLAGYILYGMTPIREPANKWYVTREEYPYNSYPVFLSGWFYLTTVEVCKQIVIQSNTIKYFWIDDLYVSGLLARKLRIKHYDLSKFFTADPEFLRCCMTNSLKLIDCDVTIGPNGGDNNLFYNFNTNMKKCYVNKCRKPLTGTNETCQTGKRISLIGKGKAIIKNYKLH